jgi:sugar phosphate isomerase/epimerase
MSPISDPGQSKYLESAVAAGQNAKLTGGCGMSTPQLALNLYTLRDQAATDLAATLRHAHKAGYTCVQWSGMPELPAMEARAALDTADLRCPSGHVVLDQLEAQYDEVVTWWRRLGARDLVVPTLPEYCHADRTLWIEGARRLDALGARLRFSGMRLSYHNFDTELQHFEGDEESKLTLLCSHMNLEHVRLELDTAWLHTAGVDPAETIRQYAGRCPLLHVKDWTGERTPEGAPVFCAVGSGCLDWDGIFAAARDAHVEWIIYEQDTSEGDMLEDVVTGYEFLTKNI